MNLSSAELVQRGVMVKHQAKTVADANLNIILLFFRENKARHFL